MATPVQGEAGQPRPVLFPALCLPLSVAILHMLEAGGVWLFREFKLMLMFEY